MTKILGEKGKYTNHNVLYFFNARCEKLRKTRTVLSSTCPLWYCWTHCYGPFLPANNALLHPEIETNKTIWYISSDRLRHNPCKESYVFWVGEIFSLNFNEGLWPFWQLHWKTRDYRGRLCHSLKFRKIASNLCEKCSFQAPEFLHTVGIITQRQT